MNLFIHWLVNAIAVAVAAYVLPGVAVAGVVPAFVAALVLGIINTLLKPILVILTLPVTVVTLGLFLLVINAGLVMLASRIVPGFAVSSFWWALLFSVVVSVVSSFLHSLNQKTASE